MSFPGKRMYTDDNDEPQIVPMAFATMTSVQDQQESHQPATSEYPPTTSAEAVQVLSVIDQSDIQQSSQNQQQPLQQDHQPISTNPGTTIDPSAIQVVTFDEQPVEIDVEVTSERRLHLQQSDNEQLEHTPLLHHASVDPHPNDINDDDEMFEGKAECHDMIWAILFYAHIVGILYTGLYVAPQGYALIENDKFDLEKLREFMENNFVNGKDLSMQDLDMLTDVVHEFQEWCSVYLGRISWFIFAMCCVAVFLKSLQNIIKSRTSFFVSSSLVLFGVAIGLFVLIILSDMGFFGFLVSVIVIGILAVYIRKRLWPKREFAALNLEIALEGIGINFGTHVWVIACAELALAWIFFWCYTVLGLIPYVTITTCPDQENPTCGATNLVLLAMLISLYWTLSHVRATIQVYVAGVMGTWCFDKDAAQGWCSTAVTSSLYRSVTFSSGPIAFGSLLQSPAKVLRSILSHSKVNQHRTNRQAVYDHGDDCHGCCFGLCGLMLECIADLFGDVLDYFSQWAYVFVGINGTSYLESGKAVTKLFQERGWTAVITDRVVALVLGIGALHGGVLTGLVSILVERCVTWIAYWGDESDDIPPSYIFGPLKNIPLVSFALGFVVGCEVSAIMMNVVQGAVNTLIVCWAESPESFRDNHKHWADQMAAVWSSTFPGTQFEELNSSPSAGVTSSGRYGATAVTR